jgi:ELWxxDGT repeat protein
MGVARRSRRDEAVWRASRHCIEALERRLLLAATLVKDLNLSTPGSNPSQITDVNGTAFFTAEHVEGGVPSGTALWRSDGTAAGTTFVRKIQASSLTNVGGTLFFVGDDGTGDREIWKSDGTPSGTVRVTNFPPAATATVPTNLTHFNGSLYFVVNDGNLGEELYKTDGTVTTLVRDIHPAPNVGSRPRGFVAAGGTLYFSADGEGSGRELWATDGTSAGTVLVKDIHPAASALPEGLTVVGGTIFFSATDGATGRELWKSDGTAAGTVLVKDIATPGDSSPANFAAVGNRVFFAASGGGSGQELWVSDGTAVGTVLVKDIVPGLTGSAPTNLVNLNGRLVFTAMDSVAGREPWTSDGTAAGTVRLADIGEGFFGGATGLTAVGDLVFFRAGSQPQAEDTELWKTDGTPAGTQRVLDIRPGSFGSAPSSLAAVGGRLMFAADDGFGGKELWSSDGTAAGTFRVKDIDARPQSAEPQNLITVGDRVFLNVTRGPEVGLWVTDGTDAGTVKMPGPSVVPGYGFGINDNGLPTAAALGNTLIYSTFRQIWRSDGTPQGTFLLRQFNPSSNAAIGPAALTAFGGRVLFFGDEGGSGYELWATDGTPAGTELVRELFPGPDGGRGTQLTVVGNTLYFTTHGGGELWKTDGTAAGTVHVRSFNNGEAFHLTNVNGTLFFAAAEGSLSIDFELWKSDGTAAGTVRVKDVNPGPYPSLHDSRVNARVLASYNGLLYFLVSGEGLPPGLWKSDGTEAGTVLVKALADVPQDYQDLWPHELTVSNGLLYFAGPGGRELWKSDGTAAGTEAVRQLAGVRNAVSRLMDVNGTLYFQGDNGTGRAELWTSDGTAAGTVPVTGTAPGPSGVGAMAAADGTLFFASTHPDHGNELFKVETAVAAPAAPSQLLAAAASGEEIDLGWRDNSSTEVGFRIQRSRDAGFATIEHTATVPAGVTAYTDTGLARGVRYYYRVTAFNRGGHSAPITASAITPVAPAAPSGFAAPLVSATRVELRWDDNATDETGYRLERSLHHNFSSVQWAVDLAADTRAYPDTAASPVTTYYYRLRARGAAGDSARTVLKVITPEHAASDLVAYGVSSRRHRPAVDGQLEHRDRLPDRPVNRRRAVHTPANRPRQYHQLLGRGTQQQHVVHLPGGHPGGQRHLCPLGAGHRLDSGGRIDPPRHPAAAGIGPGPVQPVRRRHEWRHRLLHRRRRHARPGAVADRRDRGGHAAREGLGAGHERVVRPGSHRRERNFVFHRQHPRGQGHLQDRRHARGHGVPEGHVPGREPQRARPGEPQRHTVLPGHGPGNWRGAVEV